jgi:hypothetical protein
MASKKKCNALIHSSIPLKNGNLEIELEDPKNPELTGRLVIGKAHLCWFEKHAKKHATKIKWSTLIQWLTIGPKNRKSSTPKPAKSSRSRARKKAAM